MDPAELLIAVPTRGSVRNEVVSILESVRQDWNISPIVYGSGHLSSHETREIIVRHFMSRENKQALIMCDDDTVPPEHFLRLTQWFAKYDVVGAAVPTFQPKVAPIPQLAAYDYFPDIDSWRNLADVWGRTGLVACDAVGFGCVAIHRRVFEKVEAPWFPLYHSDGDTVTDDLSFCKRVKEAGMAVACDFEVMCEHYTTVPLMKLSNGVSDLINEVCGEQRES